MTDEQWARLSEAASVVMGRAPWALREAVDALPAASRQAFAAALLDAAAVVLGQSATIARERVEELQAEAEHASDPASDAYAYPPVTGSE